MLVVLALLSSIQNTEAGQSTLRSEAVAPNIYLDAISHCRAAEQADLFFDFNALSDVGWSPDGSKIAAYARAATRIYVWSVKDGQVVAKVAREEAIRSGPGLAFFQGGKKLIVSAGPARTTLPAIFSIDVATAKFGPEVPGPFPGKSWRDNLADQFVFSPRTGLLVATFYSGGPSPFAVYQATPSGDFSLRSTHGNGIALALSLSDDSTKVAISFQIGIADIFSTANWKVTKSLDFFPESQSIVGSLRNSISSLSFSPDGRFVAAGAASISISRPRPRNLPEGTPDPDFANKPMLSNETRSPLRVYDLSEDRFLDGLPDSAQPINQMAWLSDRMLLVQSATTALVVYALDVNGIWRTRQLIPPGVVSFALSPDRGQLAVSQNNEVTIYRLTYSH